MLAGSVGSCKPWGSARTGRGIAPTCRRRRATRLVLRPGPHRRDHHRHRQPPDRPVPVVHRLRHGRDRVQHGGQLHPPGFAPHAGLRRGDAAAATTPTATSGSTGTPRRACRPGATGAWSSWAPRATSSCASTSTSPAVPARDHLFVVDGAAPSTSTAPTSSCSYYPDLVHDVINRTETACPQRAHLRSHAAGAHRPSGTRRRSGYARVKRRSGPRPTDRLRIGIVGCGGSPAPTSWPTSTIRGPSWSASRHRSPSGLRRIAAEHGTTAYGTLASSSISRPTLVSVATPPGSHMAVTWSCSSAGCSVLLEKPPTVNLADMDVSPPPRRPAPDRSTSCSSTGTAPAPGVPTSC